MSSSSEDGIIIPISPKREEGREREEIKEPMKTNQPIEINAGNINANNSNNNRSNTPGQVLNSPMTSPTLFSNGGNTNESVGHQSTNMTIGTNTSTNAIVSNSTVQSTNIQPSSFINQMLSPTIQRVATPSGNVSVASGGGGGGINISGQPSPHIMSPVLASKIPILANQMVFNSPVASSPSPSSSHPPITLPHGMIGYPTSQMTNQEQASVSGSFGNLGSTSMNTGGNVNNGTSAVIPGPSANTNSNTSVSGSGSGAAMGSGMNSGLPVIQPMPANLVAHIQQQQQQRMELQDAFQYLDRVKSEFADQPDVYGKFLQIMREFKANTIDANGVIFRVVTLFKGHSSLIQGFNAFLPKTHHIDPSVAESGILPPHILAAVGISQSGSSSSGIGTLQQLSPPANVLSNTPSTALGASSGMYQNWNASATNTSGIDHQQKIPLPSQQTQTMMNASSVASASMHQQQSLYSQNPNSGMYYPQGYGTGIQQPSQSVTPQRSANLAPIQPFVRGGQPMPLSSGTMGTAPMPPSIGSMGSGGNGMGGVGGSNNGAINQPSTASNLPNSNPQFNRAIGYVKKIKHRFSNEPEVYKSFLGALHSYHKEQKSIHEVYDQVAQLFKDNQDLLEEFLQFLPEQDASNLLKSGGGVITSIPGGASIGIGGIGNNISTLSSASAKDRHKRQISTRAMKRIKQQQNQVNSYQISNQTVSSYQKNAEESDFFDQVKKHLGDRHVYAEFLKVLNLFSQDIIKLSDLVNLVHGFIGGVPELFNWFKKYVGYKDGLSCLADLEAPIVPNVYPELNLDTCSSKGSYRILPKNYKLPEATGRTILCEEVLNDRMVSCPSFNSEDGTFIGSKKNQYEEALFRCEDERFEMDLLIEQNMATISVLEPIARKIDMMSDEERIAFNLDNRLGGSSTIIYYKSIKSIYGDKADEIMEGLSNNSATAVPIVLKRLKQKNEEWKRIQRDWNKIWREIHLKNYYKSLDHLGIEFRANDKKNFNIKYLINEIESKALEISKKQVHLQYDLSFSSSSTHPKESFLTINSINKGVSGGNGSGGAGSMIGELESFYDNLSELVKLSGKQNISSTIDRRNVYKFLDSFIRDFFSLEKKKQGKKCKIMTSISMINGNVRMTDIDNNRNESDNGNDSNSSSSPSTTNSNSDNESTKRMIKKKTLPIQMKYIPRILYTNNNVFALIRLIVTAMERLEKMKSNSKLMDGKSYFQEKTNIIASFLDLQTKQDYPELSNDFYSSLVYLLKQLLVGQLDPEIFEERVRFMFGTAAYPIFTFDKLLQAIIRQTQIVITDNSAQNTINLFQYWLQQRSEIRLSEYSALIAAEYYVDSRENLFRIEYNPKTCQLSFQLLERFFEAMAAGSNSSNSNTLNNQGMGGEGGKCPPPADSKWISYVDEFVKLQINDSLIDNSSNRNNSKVFLRRCIRRSSKERENVTMMDDRLVLLYNLECKISLNSYKLVFVEGTEDFIYWKKNMTKRLNSLSLTPQTPSRSFQKFRRWWQKSWTMGLSNRQAEEATKKTDRWFKQGI